MRFDFWKKKEAVPPVHEQVAHLAGVAEGFDKRITHICEVHEQEVTALKEERTELIERVSTLETKVANLNTIIMAVANGFSSAMEELDDV